MPGLTRWITKHEQHGHGSRPAHWPWHRLARARRGGDFLLATLLLVLLVQPAWSARAAQNGAGIVVRHGDGRLIYAYVQFSEDSISGLELLRRSGLDLVSTSMGLGEAVCAINGEGCGPENCFCKSYGNPSYYWRYNIRQEGRWVYAPTGAGGRVVKDGDIDGWDWPGGPGPLPNVTIDEIAAKAGVARAPRAPSPTPPPPTPVPPTQPPATATSAPPTPAPARPAPTATPPPVVTVATSTPATAEVPLSIEPPDEPSAAAGTEPGSVAEAQPVVAARTVNPPRESPTQPPSPTSTSTATPTPPATATPLPATPTASAAVIASPPAAPRTPTTMAMGRASPIAQAVLVGSDGATTAPTADAQEGAADPWAGYAAVIAIIGALTAYLLWSRHRAGGSHDDPDAR